MIAAESFAPEFSVEVLRRRYLDLAGLDDRALVRHYETFGESEGRVAADIAVREAFVAMAPPETALLEIGPFCQPVFTGPNVKYLDILDVESLRRRATEIGIDPDGCPQEIHYTSLAEAAGAQLDVIFSSHNIEHQPDLVRHFQQASEALKPGGLYMLLVPDKRYCFDHFIPESTIEDVLGAYAEKRTVHAAASVVEHVAFTCHNDILRHWNGDHGPAPTGLDGRVEIALQQIEDAAGSYIDVHAWQFTPASFRLIVTALRALNLSPFSAARVYDTPWGKNEFAVVLTLSGSD